MKNEIRSTKIESTVLLAMINGYNFKEVHL